MSKELAIFLICYMWLGIFYCISILIRVHNAQKEYSGIDSIIDHICMPGSLISFTVFWFLQMITELIIRNRVSKEDDIKYYFLSALSTSISKEIKRAITEKELIAYIYIIYGITIKKNQ